MTQIEAEIKQTEPVATAAHAAPPPVILHESVRVKGAEKKKEETPLQLRAGHNPAS